MKIATLFSAAGASAVVLAGTVALAPPAMATEQVNCTGAWDSVVISWAMDGSNKLCYEGAGNVGFGSGLPQSQSVEAGKYSGYVTVDLPEGNFLFDFKPNETVHIPSGGEIGSLHID